MTDIDPSQLSPQELTDLMFENKSFFSAVGTGNVDDLRDLIRDGRTMKHRDAMSGHTLMTYAVHCDQREIVKVLIEEGADINEENDMGVTPLIYAAGAKGNLAMVELLLDLSAHINHQARRNTTALGAAAEKGHTEVVETLLQRGADATLADDRGRTPREIAAAADRLSIVDIFNKAASAAKIAEAQPLTLEQRRALLRAAAPQLKLK